MSAQGEVQEAHHELKTVIASGQLSAQLHERAENLLQRIERPFRLSVMGLPGSGRSTLLNLLLGADVLPEGARLPTLQLSYGDTPSIQCTLPDGSTETLESDDLSALADLKPAFAQVFLPLPALTKLSMMEVVAGSDPREQMRAIQWATKRTDIALWCSKGSFEEEEEDLWSHAPEKVQDHAFLMLTNADTSAAQGDLQERLAAAKTDGRDYFKNILPIGTKAAIAARKPDGTVDKEALRSSGGVALISSILRDVEAARESAADQAHVFLRQIDFTTAPKTEQKTAKAKAKIVEEAPKPAEMVQPEPKPVKKVKSKPKKAKQAKKPEPKAAAPKKEAAKPAELLSFKPESRAAIEIAVEQLNAEGTVMLESLQSGALDDVTVIETCVDTVKWLDEYLSNSGVKGDALYSKSCEAAVDAADLIQLIQLEPGDSVASDALSLMVQLKQDMQSSLAA
ncbi:MAG: hypothetical protein AAF340_04090 [Pseudomonadota bacterium]